MYKKVLLAYDDSEQAARAFEHALTIAARFQSEMLVISVVQFPEPATRVETDAVLDNSKRHFEDAFEKLRKTAESRGFHFRSEIEIGHAADKILCRAEKEGAELIVCGRRGRSPFDRFLLGSVSARLVRHARCAVLVVH